MKNVYVLQHENKEDIKFIGIYSSEDKAERAVAKLSKLPGFENSPNIVNDGDGFYIDKYDINETHWKEGFIDE